MDNSKLLGAFKFGPRVLFGIALSAGIAVFSPPRFVAALGFQELLQQHRLDRCHLPGLLSAS